MPKRILPTTLFSRKDEPCVLLVEVNRLSPDNRGMRRYQIVVVVRNDRPAEFRTDMGPATEDEQFRVLGCVEDEVTGHVEVLHTVEELREIADYLRDRRSGWTQEIEAHDLVRGYHNYMEELPLVLRHVSVSGPLVTISR